MEKIYQYEDIIFKMEKYYYNSPIGFLELGFNNEVLTSLRVISYYLEIKNKPNIVVYFQKQLDEYFLGKRKIFDIKISPKGTLFQRTVWDELMKIPYGNSRSYSDVAKRIGKINAQRAVGGACNKNPILIVIPCHRVLSQTGKLTGFSCGLEIKNKLLKLEGVIK